VTDDGTDVIVGLKSESGVRLGTRIARFAARPEVEEFSLEER